MDFRTFYLGLDAAERKRFADEACTSTRYIEVHLMSRRKIPKPLLMGRLSDACALFNASLTKGDLLTFFYDGNELAADPVKDPA